jgi:hypothetical protein
VFIPCKLGFGVAFNAIVVIDGLGLVLTDGLGLVVMLGVGVEWRHVHVVCGVVAKGVGVEWLHVHVACGVVAKGVVGAGYALQAGQAGHTGGTISVFKIYLSLKQSGIWSEETPFGKHELKSGGAE